MFCHSLLLVLHLRLLFFLLFFFLTVLHNFQGLASGTLCSSSALVYFHCVPLAFFLRLRNVRTGGWSSSLRLRRFEKNIFQVSLWNFLTKMCYFFPFLLVLFVCAGVCLCMCVRVLARLPPHGSHLFFLASVESWRLLSERPTVCCRISETPPIFSDFVR